MERADRGRDVPFRYLLVHEESDRGEVPWARCTMVQGLFAPPRTARNLLRLRGCDPRGRLDAALDPDGPGPAAGLSVEVDGGHEDRVQWFLLSGVHVLGRRPDPEDPRLWEVFLEADVVSHDRPLAHPPGPWARYTVYPRHRADEGSRAHCRRVDGLYDYTPPSQPPLRLLGCEPTAELRGVLRRPRRWRGAQGLLRALDRDGRVLRDVLLDSETVETRPSVLGGTLVDITLEDEGDDRPDPQSRPVWELWGRGVPREAGLWRPLPTAARWEWLRLAMANRSGGPDRAGGAFLLDGAAVTDEPGLYCALAEALVGPGRYYGWNLDALDDCLRGGFGPLPPFTLVWEHLEESRRLLPDLVDAALEVLRARGVGVRGR
ncbi:barstar family protein [Nocardiopsis changdeensis]|uniref:Barstar family protein n=1 Tax=Nocardiopsis changdeensis TaxID=2831969 RepID=A0ABX8BWJ4_9ACTN|nr:MULTISPECIES: barstar family protein [Nocardiopsis]QUX25589.1 barstar family protein [Nocardiopsis changdeensis]QYX35975.1 barstar family protein [Nocardiopsis sp. MT53]